MAKRTGVSLKKTEVAMKAVYRQLNRRILVLVYVVKENGKDEYVGRLLFEQNDWQAFMLTHPEWRFIAQ